MDKKAWKTDRCVIKPFAREDILEAIRIFTDDEVRRYLGGTLSKENAKKRLYAYFQQAETQYYTVRLSDTASFIGMLELAPYHDPVQTELSYYFLPEYWGHGYAYEAMSVVLKACREDMAIDHVVSETQTENHSSCRMLEKLGYRKLGERIRFQAKQAVYEIRWKS